MPEILFQCYSIEDGSLLWGLNTTTGPVILNAITAQTYFDRLYNISHDFDFKRDLCPD